MKKGIIILVVILLILLATTLPVIATVTHTLNAPSNFTVTQSTSLVFNWTPISDVDAGNLTSRLIINGVINQTITETNGSNFNVTVGTFATGYYLWNITTQDTDGNVTSRSVWLQIRPRANDTFFRWKSPTGSPIMTLDKDTGDLNISGTLNAAGGVGISGNLAMGSNNITGISWLFLDKMNATIDSNIDLESDLDGTGVTITAGTFTDATITITGGDLTGGDDINATEAHLTNIFALNLETNLDGTGYNITAAELNGNLDWTDLQTYPAACSAGYALTQLDDTITCTRFIKFTGDTIPKGVFDWNQSNHTDVNEVSATLIDTTNLEADNLEANMDGSGFNITMEVATITTISATNYGLVENDIPTLSSSWSGSMDADQLTGVDSLNNAITLQGENITGGTVAFARLPNLTNTHNLAAENITAGTFGSGNYVIGNLTVPKVTIDGTGTQDYSIFQIADVGLSFQGLDSGDAGRFKFYSKDNDRTDNNLIEVYGFGSPTDTVNKERLLVGWLAARARFEVFSDWAGTGTAKELALHVNGIPNQLVLQTNGNINISGSVLINQNLTVSGTLTGTASNATLWDGETSQANLNVNSSGFWDNLNSPTAITSLGTISSATSITTTNLIATNLEGNLDGTGFNLTIGKIDTGQGANELYDMDQNIQTTDSPTFNELNVTGIAATTGKGVCVKANGNLGVCSNAVNGTGFCTCG